MFIDILEKELKERKISLNKLAKLAGVSQTATSRWKHGGYPSIEALIKICEYLGVSADYLLELEPPPTISKDEKWLLRYYKNADERGKEFILEIAEREAERANKQETSLNSKIG